MEKGIQPSETQPREAQPRVAKKILDDAEKERAQILKEAEQEVGNIREQTQQELDRLKKETERQVKETVRREKKRIVGMAKLGIRNELLRTKRAGMDYLFNEALTSLINKEESEYLGLIKKLLILTGANSGEIICGENEKRINQEFVKQVNEELGANFVLSTERRAIRGGFILSKDIQIQRELAGRQGKVEIDCSFETLLNTGREKTELELAKLVFGEEQINV